MPPLPVVVEVVWAVEDVVCDVEERREVVAAVVEVVDDVVETVDTVEVEVDTEDVDVELVVVLDVVVFVAAAITKTTDVMLVAGVLKSPS